MESTDYALSGRSAQQWELRRRCRHPSGEYSELTLEEVEGTVPARFARIVAAYPSRTAYSDLDHKLTYAELDRASNRCAHALLARRGSGPEPIVITMGRGQRALIASIGVTKAGKFYAVVAPDTPPEQLAFIIRDLNDAAVIVDDHGLDAVRRAAPNHTPILGAEELLTHPDCGPVAADITADSLYMLRYTSGSTGRRKGVVHQHRDNLQRVRDLNGSKRLSPYDREAGVRSGLYGEWVVMAGAAYYHLDLQQYGTSMVLRKLLEHEITVLDVPVTTFRHLVRSVEPGFVLPRLRFVRMTGEPPTLSDILNARNLVTPDCIFCNSYGTTESYGNTAFLVTTATAEELDSLPAGYPTEDKELLLLDDDGNPAPGGVPGEIAVRSRYLSVGYWNLPEETAARFLPDPDGGDRRIYLTGDLGRLDADGCLHTMGRKDDMVKIRGYRVEFTALEDALRSLPNVKDAAVVARDGPSGDLRPVAYIEVQEPRPTVSTLREALSRRFPVTPAQYVFMDKLPHTATSKVDRRALPDPGAVRPHLDEPYAAPRTPVEEQLARIWAQVLGLDQVGIHDHFLDLGGDSLLASQVVTRVIRALRVSIPLSALYASPTVADMAVAVLQAQSRLASPDEIEHMIAQVESTMGETER